MYFLEIYAIYTYRSGLLSMPFPSLWESWFPSLTKANPDPYKQKKPGIRIPGFFVYSDQDLPLQALTVASGKLYDFHIVVISNHPDLRPPLL